MNAGTLKWTEIIVRELEPQDIAKVVEKMMNVYDTAVTAGLEMDGTYTASCKVLTEGWKDLPIDE